jgi:hypothetical protein
MELAISITKLDDVLGKIAKNLSILNTSFKFSENSAKDLMLKIFQEEFGFKIEPNKDNLENKIETNNITKPLENITADNIEKWFKEYNIKEFREIVCKYGIKVPVRCTKQQLKEKLMSLITEENVVKVSKQKLAPLSSIKIYRDDELKVWVVEGTNLIVDNPNSRKLIAFITSDRDVNKKCEAEHIKKANEIGLNY